MTPRRERTSTGKDISQSPSFTAPAADISVEWEQVFVTDEWAGQRLDRVVAALRPDVSRTRAQVAIKAGDVLVNGRPAKASQELEAGQTIALGPGLGRAAVSAQIAAPQAEAIPLQVVYEDEHLLVVDKPAGLVTHPAPGHPTGTLVNALLAHAPEMEESDDPRRPGIVHRLDKDTSGLLVIAKDAPTHAALTDQMKRHEMVKRYFALVEGIMEPPAGVIDAPIGRDPRTRLKMALVSEARGGRSARTRYSTIRAIRGRTLLDVQLETGRTHQIRVHMAAMRHPVVGDVAYGRANQRPEPPRQFLHATRLELRHPTTGEWMVFESPLPPDLSEFLARLESEQPAGR